MSLQFKFWEKKKKKIGYCETFCPGCEAFSQAQFPFPISDPLIFVFYQWYQRRSVTAHSHALQGQTSLWSLTLFNLHPFQMLCGKCWYVAPWSRSPNTMLWWRAASLMPIDRGSQMNKQHFYRYEQWTAMHDISIEQTRWTRQCSSVKKLNARGHNQDMFTLFNAHKGH